MTDKEVIFITGANTGLGYEIVKALVQSGKSYVIIVGSRDAKKGEDAVAKLNQEVPNHSSSLIVVQADVTSDGSLEKAVKTITDKYGRLDILINNAGAAFDRQIQSGNMSIREAWNTSWDTNVAGAQVLTTLCIPLLLKSENPRLMFVTSGTSSLNETGKFEGPLARINASPAAGWPKSEEINPIVSYRSTKTGLNMMAKDWQRVLKNDGVKVFIISPGFLATGLAGIGAETLKKMGARDPSEGGTFIRDVVEGKRDHDQGKVLRFNMVQEW